jgi:hypothetical protein
MSAKANQHSSIYPNFGKILNLLGKTRLGDGPKNFCLIVAGRSIKNIQITLEFGRSLDKIIKQF